MWANSEYPDQVPRSGSALFAYVPKMGRDARHEMVNNAGI